MGTIFEELVRRFNEENNEEAGEHWTPGDAVKLMANLIFLPVADQIESGTYLLYDGACGTGGMLTVGEETLQHLAKQDGKEVATHLYGQDINAETYAICKADLLLKGEGEAADNIVGGPEHSTLSNDAFPSREFDFMLSNPPYGKSWKSDLERMGGKEGIKDPRFIIEHAGDPEYSLITRSSDGQMLFLANMLLNGIKAVQTLSRLNRARPQKHDTFVLDFMNDADTIREAFSDYYRTTLLSEETDPNKLHDLKAALDGYQVYAQEQIDQLVALYLGGADRDKLDPILDACVATYKEQLDEDGQVDFKGKAKVFVRTYGFLSSILPYTNADWEKLSIFLNFLIPKLPAPEEQDLSKGILEAIDMDSYRVEKQAAIQIQLPDADAEIAPVPTIGGGHVPDPELARLSNILKAFNDQFGNIDWKDADKISKVITEEIPAKVAADQAYQNAMKNSDKQNARIEHDIALKKVLVGLLSDHTELFKQFSENPAFQK
jgi:N-6 DNA Methylase